MWECDLKPIRLDAHHIEQRAIGIEHARLRSGHRLYLSDLRTPLNPNATLDRLRHRAARVVQGQGTLRLLALAFRNFQAILDVHLSEQEHLVLSLLDVPFD